MLTLLLLIIQLLQVRTFLFLIQLQRHKILQKKPPNGGTPARENKMTNKEIASSGCFLKFQISQKYSLYIVRLFLISKDTKMLQCS